MTRILLENEPLLAVWSIKLELFDDKSVVEAGRFCVEDTEVFVGWASGDLRV